MTNDGSKRISLVYYQPLALYRLPVLYEKSTRNILYIGV